jgi:hypothetical protein
MVGDILPDYFLMVANNALFDLFDLVFQSRFPLNIFYYFKTKSQIFTNSEFFLLESQQKIPLFVKDSQICCMVLMYERQAEEKTGTADFRFDSEADRAAE